MGGSLQLRPFLGHQNSLSTDPRKDLNLENYLHGCSAPQVAAVESTHV